MDELIDEKIKVVLNLLRTNNTQDEALKFSQAFVNMANGKNILQQGTQAKTKRASA